MSLAVVKTYYNHIDRLWVEGLQIVQPKPSRDTLTRMETNFKEIQIAMPAEKRRNYR